MAYSLPDQLEADLAAWEIESRPSPSREEVEELRAVIDSATDERPIQSHLASNPRLFSPLLGGGHGRWVRPKVRLSDRYEADFLIADADSLGINWTYVELESPGAAMFLQNGELAEKARHGIHQIHQWRDHIDRNGGEARRLRSEGGLGLPDIRSKGAGLVLVGRRESMRPDLAQRRRQLLEDERIMLHTYDWLVDQLTAIADDPSLDHHLGGVIPSTKRWIRMKYSSSGARGKLLKSRRPVMSGNHGLAHSPEVAGANPALVSRGPQRIPCGY